MPRKRTGERVKGQFSSEDIANAIRAVRAGSSIRNAAKTHNVKKSTLQRYVESCKNTDDLQSAKLTPNYACHKVFTEEQEAELTEYLIECAKMGFGLDTVQVRKLAFQMAEVNDLAFPKNWSAPKMAGIDWLYGFRDRHSALSMRKPEACSKNRASAFTPENMNIFFSNLKNAMERHPTFANGSRVYNLDEFGATTVGAVKRKIFAPSGVKQIPQAKTAERGTLVTTCCIINAHGTTLPPAMIFPRKNFQNVMLHGAYPGTLGLAAKSGWMNSETFAKVMQHFVDCTHSSKENPTLLIMDNDASHFSLEALNIAKSNGVIILTLSPHTSHKTQPLDVAIFSPLRTYYDDAIRNWIMNNPGKNVTIYHVALFVRIAMEKAMSPGNIMAGFRKTGIFPYDPAIFTEADYIASLPYREFESSAATEAAADAAASSTVGSSFKGPYAIRGLPKAKAGEPQTQRKKGRSLIPTDSPEKRIIEAKRAASQQRQQRQGQNKKAQRAVLLKKSGKSRKNKKDLGSSESKDNSPVSLADSDDSDTWAEDTETNLLDPDSFFKLDRDPKEGEYLLIRKLTTVQAKRRAPESYRIAKAISATDEGGNVQVSFLKKSEKVKDKFLLCNPPDVKTLNVKESIAVMLPKPSVVTTRRQSCNISFSCDFSLVSLE